jgi:uncharacterized protein
VRQTTLIVHHSPCADGFCAAWVAHKSLRNRPGQDVEFFPTNYGEDPPLPTQIKNKTVFMLDFSYPLETMQQIQRDANALIVLDHHKTAQKALEQLTPLNPRDIIRFNMEKSGARLTWEYFFGGRTNTAHWLVEFTEDRDLWRHALSRTREINAAIRSYAQDFAVWDQLSKKHPDTVAIEGEAIVRRDQHIIQDHLERAYTMGLGSHRDIPVVNCSAYDLTSDIVGALAEGHPFATAWFLDEHGTYHWSLRSHDNGIDVSEIAKRYGGGGHAHAAGFRSLTQRPDDVPKEEKEPTQMPPFIAQDPSARSRTDASQSEG